MLWLGGRHSRYVWDGRAIRSVEPGELAGGEARNSRLLARLRRMQVRGQRGCH